MSNSFRISFIVSAKKLEILTDILKNEVSDLQITQIDQGLFGGKPKRTIAQPINSKNFGIGRAFCVELGKGKKFNTTTKGPLAKKLAAASLSPSSVSPLCTQLTRAGIIRRTGRGEAEVV